MSTGSQSYRTGFSDACWGEFEDNAFRSLRRPKRENLLSKAQELYHYTSLAGLKGIIEEKGFWISDNRFMNDVEESRNGIRLAREVLQHRAKRSRELGFKRILWSVDELIAAPREHGHLIACFSTARDDLGQWRGYASGGVCLRVGMPNEGEAPLFFGPDRLPFEVIYDDLKKRILLLSVIKSFERQYALDRIAMPTNWPDTHDANYKDWLYSRISISILGFKNQSFRAEAEARIVLPYQEVSNYEGGLRFRVSPLGLIPYLRTGDHFTIKQHGGQLALRELMVGPARHQTLIAQSVETFLRQSGYSDTKITLSTIPYRVP